MKEFEQWYKELISDERWYENAIMSNRGKNFKGAAEFVYAQLLADPDLQRRPMVENRKHVYNRLCKMDYERVFPSLQQDVKEDKKEEAPPLTGEAREKKLQEWLDKVKASEMQSAVPRLTHAEIAKEGGWERAKDKPYPITSPMEVYVKERHIAYIKEMYDARTAEKMPYWIPEEEFNLIYDQDYEDEKLK